jgi:L-iditol 2-dehydrogenase
VFDLGSEMEALVLTGPGTYEIRQVPVPVPVDDEVLCRVRSVAICGSDPKIVKGATAGMWPPSYPFIIGHEWAGEVVAVSPDLPSNLARRFTPGTRVAGEAHKGCGLCENCLRGRYNICLNYGDEAAGHRHYGFTSQGAYAEYTKASTKALHPLPEGLSYDEAAMLDTAGVAVHAVQRASIAIGDSVVVVGDGPIGNLTMQYARAAGAGKVIVVGSGKRLQAAVGLGAAPIDFASSADPGQAVWELTGGRGADVVFECAGVRASCEASVLMARKGGKVVMVGNPIEPASIPWGKLCLDEIDLIGCRANPNVSESALCLMSSVTINAGVLLTHRFALGEFREALATFVEQRDGAMKVVINP